ncbi:trimethylamine--corrinoid protein Co-methyltransferase [Rhodobium orientis]|uniref:Methyltransferase n=1 Tax=Rhodobium orientis TaxID=34017 RepID=A0A327JJS5_9HYPH|nr:trimethylamine methyltransferase family protein [Rhodobium orientis]MBB4302394.1 trimethylamine--corrinoid protein Co-methyltransferase [Rhodobium orientis]MBK5949098.1 trimethylamine methyltransferase [Rhodobium orientis]RAI26579.1 trimethylamine methyltransferase [Rhodobium orientis]
MASETEGASRRGRGGRTAKRAQRDASRSVAPAYLTRRIGYVDLLREEELDKIVHHSDRILAEIGIEFRGDPEALAIWQGTAAEIDGERVRFPKGMLDEIIANNVKPVFTQHARNPARSVQIGGDHTVFVPAYGPPFVRDLEGGRRYASLKDFENFVKLAYMSPHLHHSGGTICEPVEIPVNKRHLDMVYAHMRWSDKPFMGSVTAPERATDTVEMCKVLFGADFVDQNCVVSNLININSPLVFDNVMSSALRVYAAANQCCIVTPFILGGAMGPVTIAAALAQAHAEARVGIALTQLIRPGAPVIYGNFFSSLSLKTGAPTFGMPEPALSYLAIGQLARRIGVPLRCGGSLTASKIADFQAAQESVDSLVPAVQSGANFILHAAGWLEGGLVMGYEKFVLDADRLGMMARYLKGIDLDDNGFGMDAFAEVGPGSHFLGCAHTMANFETAYINPPLTDSESFEQWHDGGEKDANMRAHERWKAMLESYVPPEIDPDRDAALQEFISKRKESMPDAWH